MCNETVVQIAGVLIPLSQALYANGDMDPARQACTRALKILQRAFGNNPTIEVSMGSDDQVGETRRMGTIA